MRLSQLMFGLFVALAMALPASAQRAGEWEQLGQERVGFDNDRDVIVIGKGEDFFRERAYRRLRFVAEGGDVRMRAIRITYLNGTTEDVEVDQTLRSGQAVDVDLKGERSYLRQIEMIYRAKFSLSFGQGGIRLNQPLVKVFGEAAGRGLGRLDRERDRPLDRGADRGGWEALASTSFSRRDDEVSFDVGRREGRFGRIRLALSGNPIQIRDVRIRFGNGETQVIRVNEDLEDGQQTRSLDLEGDRRFIERVVISLSPRRRSDRAELTLLGTERGGTDADDRRPPRDRGRAGLVPLGRTEVGFTAERDVIRIERGDWASERGFDKLHFIAENSEIYMRGIRVVYQNGYGEDYSIDRLIPVGGDLVVDLRGERRFIREIEMLYRARPGYRGRALMSVFGEPFRR
jgi:hypothetical protein